ncbi:uncharacterized protein RHO25_004707 [Cercospora beticola]|uniref:Uncharacterized protein n=1 Tax=Cercospora beticola TaxID=122368 RepID=A0ABZ0NKQ5_CERBT|nr:hypothetical protein RHO25_004707 [Cercospora beticola]CAK1361729.1 unnamed protein product [Cercospora beticola]
MRLITTLITLSVIDSAWPFIVPQNYYLATPQLRDTEFSHYGAKVLHDKRQPLDADSDAYQANCLGCKLGIIRQCNPFVCPPSGSGGRKPNPPPSPNPPRRKKQLIPQFQHELQFRVDVGFEGFRSVYHTSDAWIAAAQTHVNRGFDISLDLSENIDPHGVYAITDICIQVSGNGGRYLYPVPRPATPRYRGDDGRTMWVRGRAFAQGTLFRIDTALITEIIRENGGSTGVTWTIKYNLQQELKRA